MDAITLRNTLFVVGAIIMAIEQGLRSAPEFRSRLPRVFASEYWNFAPLILMTIAGVIWVVRAVETSKAELAATPSAAASVSIEPLLTTDSFGVSKTETLLVNMLALPRPCSLRLTAPPENMRLRNQLRSMATMMVGISREGIPPEDMPGLLPPNTTHLSVIYPCLIVQDDYDMHPENFEEKRSFPSAGVVIRAKTSWLRPASYLESALRQTGLRVRHGSDLPESSNILLGPDIEIDFGMGSPWENNNSS